MRKAVIFLLSLIMVLRLQGQEQTWREIPYFLKGYEALYEESPQKAALSWFKDARFGLFIHWRPAALYGKGEWVMYNEKIPYQEYEQKAKCFKGDKFNAQD